MNQRLLNVTLVFSLFLTVAASAENTAIIPVPRTTVPTNWMANHEAFVARARELAAKYGDRFLPPDSLT